jgi:hypothetical protein
MTRPEAGKFYRSASDEKVGPIEPRDDTTYPWVWRRETGTKIYTSQGANYLDHRHDLVAEWVDPVEKPAGTFKVGDKVRHKTVDQPDRFPPSPVASHHRFQFVQVAALLVAPQDRQSQFGTVRSHMPEIA